VNTEAIPFDWARKVKHAVIEDDSIPLFKKSSPFAWKEFSAKISQVFEVEGLNISSENSQWRDPKELLSGMGSSLHITEITMSPIEGKAYWVIDDESYSKMIQWLFKEDHESLNIQDPQFHKAFKEFIVLESCNTYQTFSLYPDLIPRISQCETVAETNAFCRDIHIKASENQFWGRLIITAELQKNLKTHSQQKASPPPIIAQDAEVSVQIEAGHCSLHYAKIEDLAEGDFLILDACTLDPSTNEGEVRLKVNNKILARAKAANQKLTIIEQSQYH
jgi:flagellar motor switch protein FliN/FliY